jgi:hypothetical protein
VLLARRLAQLEIRVGMGEQGLQRIESTWQAIQSWLEENGDSSEWFRIKAELDVVAGQLFLGRGNRAGASMLAIDVVNVSRQLIEQEPTRLSNRTLLINSLILEARTASLDPQSRAQHSNWKEVLEIINESEQGRFYLEGLDAYVRVALYTGNRNIMDEKIELLHEVGYQHPDFVAVLNEYEVMY